MAGHRYTADELRQTALIQEHIDKMRARFDMRPEPPSRGAQQAFELYAQLYEEREWDRYYGEAYFKGDLSSLAELLARRRS